MSDQDEAEPSAAPYVPTTTTTAEDTGAPAPGQARGRQPLTGNLIIQAITEGHSVVLTILAVFIALLVGAVLIVSSELDEIYALADRIAVMYEGQIVAFCPPTIPEQELGLLMAGSHVDGATAPGAEGEAAGSATPGAAGEPEKPVTAQEPSSHE